MEAHREIEGKWEVAETVPVPDLLQLPKVASVHQPRELVLESVYFDTERFDLMRAGVTLRRRTGGDDDGWHIKLPRGAGEREEIQEPVRRGATVHAVPKRLTALVQVHARGRKLSPVATVRNRRVVHRLLAKDGTPLADLCDDRVSAESPAADGSATISSWREWELELVEGSGKLLAAADELVGAAGATPSTAPSKLARTVGAPALPHTAHDQEPSKRGPAGVVVWAHLRDQVETLKALDPQVRRDMPDAIHKMRVTTRRLRSALATFEPLLDAANSDELRAELKWLADALGGARDAEVMRDRLATMAARHSPDPSPATENVGEGARGLGHELEGRYRTARKKVLCGLGSSRYYRLLDSLDALLSAPPWTSTAAKPAAKSLRAMVRRDWKRLAKRSQAVQHAETPAERDIKLHEVRRAAKRLRYACEALSPVFGDGAARLGDAAKELQEVLGEHQDSVVSQQLLRDLADRAVLHGEEALILGRLHLLEQQHAERSLAHFVVAWANASDTRLRRWLAS